MDVSNDSYDVEIDEDFESQKKLIEEELQRIVAESEPEEVADKILSAAESIQKLADRFGNDEVNLSPSIDRLRLIKTEHTEDSTEHTEDSTEHTEDNAEHTEDNTEHTEDNTKGDQYSKSVIEVLPKSKQKCLFLFPKTPILGEKYPPGGERLTSINAVPKVRLRSDDEMFASKTNSKRNTIGLFENYIFEDFIIYLRRPCSVQQSKSQ